MKKLAICSLGFLAFANISDVSAKKIIGVTKSNLTTKHYDDGSTETTVDSGTHTGDGEATLFSFSELGSGVDALLGKAKQKAKDAANKVGTFLVNKTTDSSAIAAAAANSTAAPAIEVD